MIKEIKVPKRQSRRKLGVFFDSIDELIEND